jgi:hypothetical protein
VYLEELEQLQTNVVVVSWFQLAFWCLESLPRIAILLYDDQHQQKVKLEPKPLAQPATLPAA